MKAGKGQDHMKRQRAEREDRMSFSEHANENHTGLILELWEFVKTNKKWWLAPIIVVLLLVGALILLSSTVAAPFVYTLF